MIDLRPETRPAYAKALRQLYDTGYSIKDIADQTSQKADAVYWLLLSVGTIFRQVAIAPMGSTERAELAETAREQYEAGLTQTDVAHSIGCDHDTARRLITEAGGKIRTEVMRGLDDYTRPILAKRLRVEYERGVSLADLSAELGCRESSVRCLLVEAGATIRPMGSSPRPLSQSTEPMSLRQLAMRLGWEPPKKRSPSRPVTDEDAARIVAGYRAGDTLMGLAAATGYPYSRVRSTLLAAGVELRSTGTVPR